MPQSHTFFNDLLIGTVKSSRVQSLLKLRYLTARMQSIARPNLSPDALRFSPTCDRTYLRVVYEEFGSNLGNRQNGTIRVVEQGNYHVIVVTSLLEYGIPWYQCGLFRTEYQNILYHETYLSLDRRAYNRHAVRTTNLRVPSKTNPMGWQSDIINSRIKRLGEASTF